MSVSYSYDAHFGPKVRRELRAVYTSKPTVLSRRQRPALVLVVLKELSALPNITGNAVTTCGALPALVSAWVRPGREHSHYFITLAVTVQYQTIFLIPIPGILTNQLTVTRIVQLAVLS